MMSSPPERIDVSWLWSLVHRQATITKDGSLKRPALSEVKTESTTFWTNLDLLTQAKETKSGLCEQVR